MSRHKMTKSEAVVILGKYFACEKRIYNCHGNCDKCKYDYDKYALRRAVEIAFKELVKPDAVEVVRCKDCKWFILDRNISTETGICGFVEMLRHIWDYCSRAERKEE